MNPKKPNQPSPSLLKLALYFSGIGMMVALCILTGYWIGNWITHQFAASDIWRGLGAIFGLIVGIVNTILLVKRFLGEDNG